MVSHLWGLRCGEKSLVVEGCHEETGVAMNAYSRGMEGAATRAFVYSISLSWSV